MTFTHLLAVLRAFVPKKTENDLGRNALVGEDTYRNNKSRTGTDEKDTIDFIYRLNGKSGFSAFQRYLARLRSSFVEQLTAVYVVET